MAVADIVPEELSISSQRGPQTLALTVAGLFTATILLAGTIALFGRASDGEPVVLLDVAPSQRALRTPTATPSTTPMETLSRTGAGAAVPAPPVIVKPVFAGQAIIADPALIENTAAGPLPRIAADGRTPMQAYAPPAEAGARPRIAIVVGGLGISVKQTAAAIAQLPAAVTLGVLSYAPDAQQNMKAARSAGHEVLLQLPMQPTDFPDSDPGPGMLRTDASPDSNLERLHEAMARFTGYAGISNFQGSRFLADAGALAPVLGEAAQRGLLFFETASPPQSAASKVAARTKSAYVQSAATLDAIASGEAIDRELSELEIRARKSGAAAATASAYPVTLARIADWARGLGRRGFVLVPASAIVQPAK